MKHSETYMISAAMIGAIRGFLLVFDAPVNSVAVLQLMKYPFALPGTAGIALLREARSLKRIEI